MGKKKQPARQATRQQYPEPSSGGAKNMGSQGYPEPQTGGYVLGLNLTTHNKSNYPQPNSANQPDSSSNTGPGTAPGPEAYRPSLAGNALPGDVVNPGIQPDEDWPDYPVLSGN